MTRSRPILGSALVLGALFLGNARNCGLVGNWLFRGLSHLVGGFGTMLVAIGLVGTGLALTLPKRSLRRLFAEARSAGRWSVERLDSQGTSSNRLARVKQVPAKRLLAHSQEVNSRKLSDFRSGLRYLGYSTTEIAGVLPRIDTGRHMEDMIRDALRLLRRVA